MIFTSTTLQRRSVTRASLLSASALCVMIGMTLMGQPVSASEPILFKNFSEVTVTGAIDRRASENNHALIIYNSDYVDSRISDLPVTEKDARAMKNLFEGMGYPAENITLVGNKGRDTLEDAVLNFAAGLGKDDTAIVYYSGHGITFDKDPENYILPADMSPDTKPGSKAIRRLQLARRALPLGEMVDIIKSSGPRGLIVFYDACRNSPLADDDGAKAIGASAAFTPSRIDGTAIFYSARRGQTSLATLGPGDDVNLSLFTRVLVSKLSKTPAMRLRDLQVELQADVSSIARDRAQGHEQRPIMEDDLDYGRAVNREFCLAAVSRDGRVQCGAADAPGAVQIAALPAYLTRWQAIENQTDPALFADYYLEFPDSPFRELAALKFAPAKPTVPAPVPGPAPDAATPAKATRKPQPAPAPRARQSNVVDKIQIGVLFDQTGPLLSTTPKMFQAAEDAMAEVSRSKGLLGGAQVTALRGDSTCTNSAKAVAAAKSLIARGISGMVGTDCSFIAQSILKEISDKDAVVMISPSASSPSLSDDSDRGLFFRTATSDNRQSIVMAEYLRRVGHDKIAIAHVDGAYDRLIATALRDTFEAMGGQRATIAAYERNGEWRSALSKLPSSPDTLLVLIGNYDDTASLAILKEAAESGDFSGVHLASGMTLISTFKDLGTSLTGVTGQRTQFDDDGRSALTKVLSEPKDATRPYAGESYDAAALILLAMQAAGSIDPEIYKTYVLDVANGPGEPIYPGQLGHALELLAAGKSIDYVGATGVELDAAGDATGRFEVVRYQNGRLDPIEFR